VLLHAAQTHCAVLRSPKPCVVGWLCIGAQRGRQPAGHRTPGHNCQDRGSCSAWGAGNQSCKGVGTETVTQSGPKHNCCTEYPRAMLVYTAGRMPAADSNAHTCTHHNGWANASIQHTTHTHAQTHTHTQTRTDTHTLVGICEGRQVRNEAPTTTDAGCQHTQPALAPVVCSTRHTETRALKRLKTSSSTLHKHRVSQPNPSPQSHDATPEPTTCNRNSSPSHSATGGVTSTAVLDLP
jgi:hypothetical protein